MRVTGKARYNQRRSHPPQKFQIDGIRYTTSGKQNLCAIGSRHHLGCRSPRGETGIAANGLIQGTPLAVSKRTEEVCGRSSHGAMSPDKAAAGAKSSTCFYSEFGLGSLSCGGADSTFASGATKPSITPGMSSPRSRPVCSAIGSHDVPFFIPLLFSAR